MKKFGVSDAEIKQRESATRELDSTIAVWPEHWLAVQVFGAMQTQWKQVFTGMSLVRTGLDYALIDAVEKRIERHPQAIEPKPSELFRQLRVMEFAVLSMQ